MALSTRQTQPRAQRLVPLLVVFLLLPGIGQADDDVAQVLALRNQHPFLQVFGLPLFQDAHLADAGRWNSLYSFDVVNHADAARIGAETLILDGESYFLSLSFRRGINDWLELGIDIPVVAHSDGVFDNVIEGWHDLFGMSNAQRTGPSNRLRLIYERDGDLYYNINSGVSGIGDIQLSAAIAIRKASTPGDVSLSLRSSVKLPTGNADDLLGSGAADFSLGLYANKSYSLFKRRLRLGGFAGLLALGEGDVLPAWQESVVPVAGIAANWQWNDELGFTVQTQLEGSYFDSALEILGNNTFQFSVGADYYVPDKNLLFSVGLVEDLFANTTPDVGLHLSVRLPGR